MALHVDADILPGSGDAWREPPPVPATDGAASWPFRAVPVPISDLEHGEAAFPIGAPLIRNLIPVMPGGLAD